MLPVNIGGHSAYQDTFVSEFLKFYPDPFPFLRVPGIISYSFGIWIFL